MTSILIGAVIGIIVSIPLTIVPTRRFLRPRHERAFYSLTLIPIAMIYIGFVYYYGDLDALYAEIAGVLLFTVFALWAQFSTAWILAVGYVAHAFWDILHEIFVTGAGLPFPWTDVPPGYAAFCFVYDLIIAVYIYQRYRLWEADRQTE